VVFRNTLVGGKADEGLTVDVIRAFRIEKLPIHHQKADWPVGRAAICEHD
jgi:hypothetical protein